MGNAPEEFGKAAEELQESAAKLHSIQQLVERFNKANPTWKPCPTPQCIHPDRDSLDLALIREETNELEHAMASGDIIKIADALGDIVVVAYGAALRRGINLDKVLHDEIMPSNFTKFVNSPGEPDRVIVNGYDHDGTVVDLISQDHPRGKILKPEGYREPNIASALGLFTERTAHVHVSRSQPDPGVTDGRCPDHPNASSQGGYGLAGGGMGAYQICDECGRLFGKVIDHFDDE